MNKYVVYLRVMLGGKNKPPFPFVSPIESDPPVVAPKIMRPGRALGRVEMDDITKPWPEDRIQRVCLLAYGRPARPDELRMGLDFLKSAGDAASALARFCHTILISTEFPLHD